MSHAAPVWLSFCMSTGLPDDDGRAARIAIVDASNVANSAPSARARLAYLSLVVERLESAGYTPLIVADAGLARRVDERDRYTGMVQRGDILEGEQGRDADELILALARRHDAIVVSNDRFREWQSRFPDVVARRVGFRVRDGTVALRGLDGDRSRE